MDWFGTLLGRYGASGCEPSCCPGAVYQEQYPNTYMQGAATATGTYMDGVILCALSPTVRDVGSYSSLIALCASGPTSARRWRTAA